MAHHLWRKGGRLQRKESPGESVGGVEIREGRGAVRPPPRKKGPRWGKGATESPQPRKRDALGQRIALPAAGLPLRGRTGFAISPLSNEFPGRVRGPP